MISTMMMILFQALTSGKLYFLKAYINFDYIFGI